MHKFFLAASMLALFCVSFAQAKTPPEVLKAYKDYTKLLEGDNEQAIANSAYEAWQLAEEKMGDTKTTASLAINYTDAVSSSKGKHKKVGKAYKRAIELSRFWPEAEQTLHVADLYYKYANYKRVKNNPIGARETAKQGAKFALENGLKNSTILGELYTVIAGTYVSRGDHDETAEYSQKALDVFETADDGLVTVQPILARLYSGYSKEAEKEILGAALDYQYVMESIDGALPRNHPFMAKALGRWSSMRERLARHGRIDEAEAAGLCKCWPYDKPRNDTIKPLKRVPPVMPSKAYRSGFSIVEFDLNDDGGTKDIRVLESWPPDIFEKSSKRAVSKWVYNTRSDGETDSDRKDIITTITYRLSDGNGNVIE